VYKGVQTRYAIVAGADWIICCILYFMLKVGLVGLPNAGKSTLFNALISSNKADVKPHPFTTIDKNIGTSEVPDAYLYKIAEKEKISKIAPATITFIDIAGLIKDAHKGEGLGNQFLHHIREVNLILHVVRLFNDKNIAHVYSEINPERDIEIVNEELLFSDIQTVKNRLNNKGSSEKENSVLREILQKMNNGKLANEPEITEKLKEIKEPLFLLTSKKQVFAINIDENQIENPPKIKIEDNDLIYVCAKLEAQIEDIPLDERQEFLNLYGLKDEAKNSIIKLCYQALDLITFYTIAKRNEARAWSLKKGQTAISAAAKVHTDFAEKFIKIEQINVRDLLNEESWNSAKEKGKVITHGRDYIVQDYDILEIKINN
jgi:GTP-binding protein YchF